MWSELEDAARDEQRARVFHNTPPYSAPVANEQRSRVFPPNSTTAMYSMIEVDMLDYGTDYDRREGATPESKSSVFVNLDNLANELERLHAQVDKLKSKLSPVLMPSPSADELNHKPREASNSALADRLSSLVISAEDLNAKVRSITSTTDL